MIADITSLSVLKNTDVSNYQSQPLEKTQYADKTQSAVETSGINQTNIFANFSETMLARLEKYAAFAGGQPDPDGATVAVDSMMASLREISKELGAVTAYGIMGNILTNTENQISADLIAEGFMAGLQSMDGQDQLSEASQASAVNQKIGKILDMLNRSSEDVAQGNMGLSQALHEFFSIPKHDNQMKQFSSRLQWEWPGIDEAFKEEVMAEVNQKIAATPKLPKAPNSSYPKRYVFIRQTAEWEEWLKPGKKVTPGEIKTAADLFQNNPNIPKINIPKI